jgi:hypothetical protein
MTTVTGYCFLRGTSSWLQFTCYCSLWLQLLVVVLFEEPVHDYSYWLLFSSRNQFMIRVTGYCSLQATSSWLQFTCYCSLWGTSSWLQLLATVFFEEPVHDYSSLATVLFEELVHDYSYWLLFSSRNQFMTTVHLLLFTLTTLTGCCSLQATSSWLQFTCYCSLWGTSSWLQLLATILFKQPVHDYSYWLLFSSRNHFMITVTGYCSLQATSSWLQLLATILFKQPVHDYSYWLLFSSSNQFMTTVI